MQGLCDRLAAVASLELCEFVAVLVDVVGDRVQNCGPFLR